MNNLFLPFAGFSSLGVALFHVIGAFSPSLCAAFGAPKRLIEAGRIPLALVCFAAAGVFALWGLYAFAGAGWLPPFPFLRSGLMAIGAIYSIRGLGLAPQLLVRAKITFSLMVLEGPTLTRTPSTLTE